ncbi:MAG: polysaccharide biosynthesis protein, partial [Desulfovibrio sp.]|nr:polysaccharide biosynthesis protein [Desulfovibrio sp.]
PMSAAQWLLMLATAGVSIALWWGTGKIAPREVAEAVGLLPLLALFWRWRPPAPFEKKSTQAQ